MSAQRKEQVSGGFFARLPFGSFTSCQITNVVWIVLLQPGLLWLKVKIRHIRYFIVCANPVLQRQALRYLVF
jgi:hypothetical protein